jgi:hypothetical protein
MEFIMVKNRARAKELRAKLDRPKVLQVCRTCVERPNCPVTAGWRINWPCPEINGVYWRGKHEKA